MSAVALSAIAPIVIDGIVVNQDALGRFCLNDLHRASGGANRHRPSLWTENKQAKDLIAELGKAGITALLAVKGGSAPGTYVVRELVYAYAMWVSALFHLKVIRAYDTLVRSVQFDIPKTLGAALRLAAEQQDEIERQALALADAAPAIAHHAAVAKVDNDFSFIEMARFLSQHGHAVGRTRLLAYLRDANVLGSSAGTHNIPLQQYVERGYFRVVESTRTHEKDGVEKSYVDLTTYVTGLGHNWMLKRWPDITSKALKYRERLKAAKASTVVQF